jgi:2-amino-4-hydroxy-6-hydroxymethyldihydropteridine diphosphokinase
MHKVFLGIGGNVGNKHDNFDKVYTFIQNELGKITKSSSIYETPPWGFDAKDNFWNQVLLIETEFSPVELLRKIGEIEFFFGRERESENYNSRQMDIDILYFDDLVIETANLKIPHPHIPQRLFVLAPLAEIAADFMHPLMELTSLELLENCPDRSVIKKVEL